MSCCTNTYNLGCIYHCNQLSFGTADFGGTIVGVFTSGNIVISQSITVVEGEPLIFDMSLLNEEMAYTLTLYHDDERISLNIDGVEYDCFSVKTTLIGDAIPFVPVPGCTEMCEEAYDPTGVAGDVFDYNNMHTGVAVDGVTITGTGKTGDPLVAVGGGSSFDCSDLQGCDISLLNNDAGYLTDSILFPNGFKTVSTSRDIDNSDIGYVLYVIEDNIHLSLPTGITLTANRHIGLKLDGTKTGFSFDVENGYPVSLLTVSPDSEFVHLITGSKGGNSTLGIVSSMIINDGGDKTLNRYLYDKINLVSSSLSNYELLSNKSTSVITDQTSNTKYPTVKSVYDWVTSLGFITNVISALGFTPENVSNKQTDLTASATKYPTVDAVNIGLGTKQDTLVSGTNIKSLNGSTILGSGDYRIPCKIQLACSDETTALTAGTAKITFRMPHAMTVTAVRASLTTAQASGNIFTVDINEGGTSILSTKLTIDNTELTSTTAATPPVISDSSLADDAEITVDIDQIGNGTAKGLKITLIGTY